MPEARFRWWHHLSWSKGFHAGWQSALTEAIRRYDEAHEGPPGAARAMLAELVGGSDA